MANALLEVKSLTKHFGNIAALNDVSLTLQAGEMLALLGHNGAGKTTLMKAILGLNTIDEGQLNVLGSKAGEANHEIGYVPENVNFYPTLTGRETLLYFARLNGLSKQQANAVVLRLLDSVRLNDAADRAIKQYSKGMKQRLGLAQALLPSRIKHAEPSSPKLLILDEPTVGLDPIATMEFFEMLVELKQQGCGIIICTHVLPGLEQYLDSALILNKGQVAAYDSIDALQTKAQLPVHIAPKGLNGSLVKDAKLAPYLTQQGLLSVPSDQTLNVVQLLMTKEHLNDIQITPPTLPELYQYYIQQPVAPEPKKGVSHAH